MGYFSAVSLGIVVCLAFVCPSHHIVGGPGKVRCVYVFSSTISTSCCAGTLCWEAAQTSGKQTTQVPHNLSPLTNGNPGQVA